MTIAKLYENHKKGKVSKQSFLYEARKDDSLPWISNLTSYEDAVKILKNKGVISEVNLNVPGAVGSSNQRAQHNSYSSNAEMNEVTKDSPEEDKDVWMNMFEDELSAMSLSPEEHEKAYRAMDHVDIVDLYGMFKPKYAAVAFVGDLDDIIYKENSLNEAHDLTTAQIIDRLNVYEFKRGVDYEMSKLKVLDNISYEKVREKVAKKMAKDPLAYRYTQLANAKQVEKDDKRLSMKPVKGDNFVDKDNEMKKIKGHADEKKNTSTPKTENRKGKPKGVKEMKGSKKKPAGVKDVMKSETKETMINEMLNFFKKKDSIKENDGGTGGGIGGATPQERTDFYKGHECMTPDGIGIVIERKGSIVTVELEDGNQKDYTLNVLDAAKEKHNQAQMDADKAERDQMWANWDKDQSSGKNPYAKTFGGTLEYKPEDIHSLMKKLKIVVEKLKLKKETLYKDPKNPKAKPIVASSQASKQALTAAGNIAIPGTEDAK
tara:strand:- start:2814 stop:4280 length:1467 start_codon:yes stop_codon:yes gene_type:complete